jgi:hypothetical protein
VDAPPPDPNQTDGYLVVFRPQPAITEWRHQLQSASDADALSTYLAALERALPIVERSRYRGFSRYPIERWWEKEPPGDGRDGKARRRIWELYGVDPTLQWSGASLFDSDLLLTQEVAQEVLSLSDAPSERELLHVVRGETALASSTIGFDVGYWGGDHFSIIADAMVMPRWHPCDVELLHRLEPWSRRLNEYLLCPTATAAAEYLEWYVAQPWAEMIPREGFQIIRADFAN